MMVIIVSYMLKICLLKKCLSPDGTLSFMKASLVSTAIMLIERDTQYLGILASMD